MKKLWQEIKTLFQFLIFMSLGFYFIAAFYLQLNNFLWPLEQLYGSPRGRLISLLIGGMFIIFSLLLLFVRSKASAEEKAISFDNPVGKVKISLSAIEDFIQKIALQVSGIHEIKPRAIAKKNKLQIENKVVIWGSENLLNISNKAQEAIQSYLQEILGGEEKVEINMHIVKVLQDATKLKTESSVEALPE